MDNCLQNNDNHAHKTHHIDMQADVSSAKLAWEAWKSNDPQQLDQALAEKTRILKTDPKAWSKAMKEVDAEEAERKAAQAREAELQKELQAEEASKAAKADTASADAPREIPDTVPAAPITTAPDTVTAEKISHPGYAPESPFAPMPPHSPAYDAAYNQPPAKFYGINVGLFKLGVTNHGSIDAGVNIGLARAEVQAGLENRVEGEFMPVGGPLHARVGAGVGVNRRGFHGEAGAGANFFNLVGGDADVAGRLGKDIGVDGDVRGRALLVNGQGDAGVSLGQDGLAVRGGGNADILQTLGARGGGRLSLGPEDTGIAAGVGLKAGEDTLDFGPSLDAYSDGKVVPALHLDPGKAQAASFFPTGDREVDGK